MLTLIESKDLHQTLLEQYYLMYDTEEMIYKDGFTGGDEFERRVGHLPWLISGLEQELAAPSYEILGFMKAIDQVI